MNVDQKLTKQFEKYGAFEDVSAVTDGLTMVAEGNSGIRTRWGELRPGERQAIRGMLNKIGRILSPGLAVAPMQLYEDIAGYAMLGRDTTVSSTITRQADMFQETEPSTFRDYTRRAQLHTYDEEQPVVKRPVRPYSE